MKNILTFILCVFIAITSSEAKSINTNDVVKQIFDSISAILLQNDKNDLAGVKGQNKYLIDIEIGSSVIVSTDCGAFLDVFKSDAQGFGKKALSDDFVDICNEYNQFNDSNSSGVQHYIVYLHYAEAVFETKYVAELGATDPFEFFMDNISETDKVEYDGLIDELANKLPLLTELPYEAGREKLITLAGEYDYVVNGKTRRRVRSSIQAKKSYFLSTPLVREFKLQLRGANDKFSLRTFMEETIGFFDGKVNYEAACADPTVLNATFESQTARSFFAGYCDEMSIHPEIAESVYSIAEYIDYYPELYGQDYVNTEENWFLLTLDEWIAQFENEYVPWKVKVISTLDDICNTNSFVHINYVWNQFNEDIFKDLTSDQIECLVRAFNDRIENQWYGTVLNAANDVYLQRFNKVIQTAIDYKTVDEQYDIISVFKTEPNGIRNLLAITTDVIFADSETQLELMSSISNICLKKKQVPSSLTKSYFIGKEDHLFVWKPVKSYVSCENKALHNDYHYKIDNGLLTIKSYLHPDEVANTMFETESDLNYTPFVFCSLDGGTPESRTVMLEDQFDPFDIVGFIGGGYTNFWSNCKTNDCTSRLVGISALQFAWMIHRRDVQDLVDNVILAIEVTGTVFGAAEVALAYRTSSSWITAYYAGVLGVEVLSSSWGGQALVDYWLLHDADDLPSAMEKSQHITQVMNMVAISAAGGQVLFSTINPASACKAVAAKRNLVRSQVASTMMNQAEFVKRCEGLVGKLGVEDSYHFNRMLDESPLGLEVKTAIKAIDDTEDKMVLAGFCLKNDDVLAFAEQKEQLVNLLLTVAKSNNQKLHKLLLRDANTKNLLSRLATSGNATQIINRAIASEEFAYMLLKAEDLGIDIVSKMDDYGDDLLDILTAKIDDVDGFADELVTGAVSHYSFVRFKNLFEKDDFYTFGSKDVNWHFKFNLKRSDVIDKVLDDMPKLRGLMNDIELSDGSKLGDLPNVWAGEFWGPLGNKFDEEATFMMGNIFKNGDIQNSKFLTDDVKAFAEVEDLGNFDIMLVNPKFNSPQGQANAVLDIVFVKWSSSMSEIVTQGARAIDVKTLKTSPFQPGQQMININGNCVAIEFQPGQQFNYFSKNSSVPSQNPDAFYTNYVEDGTYNLGTNGSNIAKFYTESFSDGVINCNISY